MADSKITALTALTAADPANDMIPIVDVSDTPPASGNTKRISINNILACSPSATLASATISGDLTVRTNRLTTTTTGVGIGTAAPILPLDVRGTAGAGALFLKTTDPTAAVASAYIQTPVSTGFSSTVPIYGFWYQNCGMGNPASDHVSIITGSTERYRIDSAGTATWSNVGGAGTAMTLNSTGLGVGVTPSAWSTGKAIELSALGASVWSYGNDNIYLTSNAYFNGGFKYASSSKLATNYTQFQGTHQWNIAPSGTAGNAITFTQAMTLDASGNLLVGTTNSTVASAVGSRFIDGGKRLDICRDASTDASIGLDVYSTTAAAYRFYIGLGGTVFATNTTISAISDARLKENVQDIDVGLAAILSLKPRKFDWKAGKGKDIKGDRGFIAQEFETVFPNLVDEWKDPAPEGEAPYKSVRQDLIPVLVKAIQELTARVQTLEAK